MRSKLSVDDIRARLKKIKAFVVDQDGTAYLESHPFPWTIPFLRSLTERGIKYLFLSNNSSKSKAEHLHKISSQGIGVSDQQILSSGEATIEYLRSLNNSRDIYLLATPAVEQDFRQAGFSIDAPNPHYVVLAYDLTFTFDKLDKACRYVRRGVPFIATHEDIDWKIAPDDYRPDCGALAAAISTATGVHPKFIGKPNTEMVNAFLRRLQVSREEVAIVGDRLATDIRMGQDHDILTFLVLSGKTKADEIPTSPFQPDVVVNRTIDILDYFGPSDL